MSRYDEKAKNMARFFTTSDASVNFFQNKNRKRNL